MLLNTAYHGGKMAINYDSEYNKRIRRDVYNFNRRVRRAKLAKRKNIPDEVTTSSLKRRFDTRADLNRELKLLREYRGENLREINVTDKIKTTEWNLRFININSEKAKKYWQEQIDIMQPRSKYYPGERQRLDTAKKNLEVLNYDIDKVSQEKFDSIAGSINSFIRARNRMGSGYRGFLSEVDDVMDLLGIDEKVKNRFFKKLDTLNQEEFFYMYDKNDLIRRVYDLYEEKDEEGNVTLNTTRSDAKELIDLLIDQIDVYVDEAKNKG